MGDANQSMEECLSECMKRKFQSPHYAQSKNRKTKDKEKIQVHFSLILFVDIFPSIWQVVTEKGDFFRAWNSCMHHVVSLSLAHVHRVALEQFTLAVRQCPNREDQALLMKFCLLYGTKLLFQERGWYLEHKYLTPAASVRIRAQLLNLCESVKDDSLKVISAFNIPHTTIHAPTAGIPNTRAAEAFSPAPTQPLVQNGTRSRLAKL